MGLSGTGQLHDLFITVEGMTSGEYKNGGMNLSINYSFATTPFGDILISSTPKRIYSMEFVDNHKDAFNTLQDKLSKARYYQKYDTIQQNALLIFTLDWAKLDKIKLYLKGTEFQMRV